MVQLRNRVGHVCVLNPLCLFYSAHYSCVQHITQVLLKSIHQYYEIL